MGLNTARFGFLVSEISGVCLEGFYFDPNSYTHVTNFVAIAY
jgi:hypothetical protein